LAGEGLVVRRTGLEDAVSCVRGCIEAASLGVVDMLAHSRAVRATRVAGLEAEVITAHEAERVIRKVDYERKSQARTCATRPPESRAQ